MHDTHYNQISECLREYDKQFKGAILEHDFYQSFCIVLLMPLQCCGEAFAIYGSLTDVILGPTQNCAL